ncbi:oxidoreductase [Natronosporangium hydrolyticum]|uniref:Oxidoreductase n=1 Tax=Natronosporangium hydrolyticum TaxID=2811111 RepID=A0A895YFS2_9ACTN|nr:oxidoreductase [Natronosporangium hydrolyticum]QSB14319.1 oxidoreductase [Natronosporangium hydrolyticum]
MAEDPLSALSQLADVAPALASARAAVDDAYRHRMLRRRGGEVAAEVSLRSAVASAALAGGRYDLADARSGVVTDPLLHGALRCAQALPGLAEQWRRAPRQVLARLHLLAARGVVADELLGRPVGTEQPPVAARLDALVEVIVASGGQGMVRAAVVHGELLALGLFPGPNGVVARAAGRLELLSSGLDPRGLLLVDEVHLAREPEYVGSAGSFATGTPDGVRAWLRHCATAVEQGAGGVAEVADYLG